MGAWCGIARGAGLVLVAAAISGCRPEGPGPVAKPAPVPTAPGGLPDTPAGRALGAHLQASRAIGPGVEARYQASLEQLRSHGADAVSVIVTAYSSADRADYGTRALLVEILAETELPEALPALIEIARSPLPKSDPAPREALNPFVEEAVVRVVAIRGIGTFAPQGAQAEEVLLALLDHDARPVREEAARALWAASARIADPERRALIRRRIPPEFQFDSEKKLGPVTPPGADAALRPRTGSLEP